MKSSLDAYRLVVVVPFNMKLSCFSPQKSVESVEKVRATETVSL